jgi:hypothetical protein
MERVVEGIVDSNCDVYPFDLYISHGVDDVTARIPGFGR